MPQTALPNVGINYEWDLGSDAWKTGMDTNLILIDALMQCGVVAVGTNTPPGSPAQGEAHVIGASPTGVFASNANKFAVYNATTWTIVAARAGWMVYDRTTFKFWIFDGSAWTDNIAGKIKRPVNSQTGTTYTVALADAWALIELTNAGAIALTIPTNATAAFPIGTEIRIAQGGAGAVTISGAGVTFQSRGGLLSTAGQHAVVTLVKVATDTWRVYGDRV
jgi:hypothetical protein